MEWRLILDDTGEPSWNMAVDEAILEAFCRGLVPPTVRFYTWNGPAVSIGYFQKYAVSIRPDAQVPIVRRPTGGRAVAHGSDLTFSIVASENIIGRRVGESYLRVRNAVFRALHFCGIAAASSGCGEMNSLLDTPNCFEVALGHEILVNGLKVLGSAQSRRNGAVLQQNSLMFSSPPPPASSAIRASLPIQFGKLCEPETLKRALIAEIQKEFYVTLSAGLLTLEERTLGSEYEQRYSSEDWTRRR